MAIFTTDQIQIVNYSEMTEVERINHDLQNLITYIFGTLPGSRSFGMTLSVVDQPSVDASINDFAAELDEKVEQYIPEIVIGDIDAEFDDYGALVSLKVYIEDNEEYEEEEA